MALATEKIAETFLNIVASTPINCNWPLYAEDEVVVIYGSQSLEAVYPSDFTVTLSPPNYNTFIITPTASLLTKINDLIASPPTDDPEINYVTIRRTLDYLTSVAPEIVRDVGFLSREIERVHMRLQQLAEKVYRTVGLAPKEVGEADVAYTVDLPVPGKALIWDPTGLRLIPGPDADNIASAQGYADAAEGFKDECYIYRADSASYAAAALASANSAAASVASSLWRDVVFVSGDYTVTQADNGKLIRFDTTAANRTVTLPQISSIATPFNVGVEKQTGGANTVTINRSGTDTIDGATSKILSSQGAGVALIADTDPAFDEWSALEFGPTDLTAYAPLASPTFTGTPLVPTATLTATTQQIANMAVINNTGRNSQGAKTISTSAPSGTPADGDIWYRI